MSHRLSCRNRHPAEIGPGVEPVLRRARVSSRLLQVCAAGDGFGGGPGPPAQRELIGRGEEEPEEEGRKLLSF